jgi:hypothetical protein
MKKLILTLLTLFALCAVSSAQRLTPGVVVQQTDPTGNCNQQSYQVVINSYSSSQLSSSLISGPVMWICNTYTGQWVSSQVAGLGYTGTGADALQISPTLITPTLQNPIIQGPAPVACGATCTVSTTQSGYTFLLNQAAGSTATLPASTGSGNKYNFLVTVATTSAQEKILLTTVADVIVGTAILQNSGTAKIFVGNAGTYHSIQMPYAGTQPSGGFIGDTISCLDVAAGTWACQVVSQSGNATPVTPYSTSTT